MDGYWGFNSVSGIPPGPEWANVRTAMSAILDNPLVLAVLALAIGAVVFAVLKKLLKLALIFALGIVAIGAYFAWTGETPPPAMEKGAEKAKALGAKVKAGATKAAKEGAKAAARKIEEEAKEALEEAR